MISPEEKWIDRLDGAQPLRLIKIPGDPSNPTRTRWGLYGVLNSNGERVKLQVWKVGGRLYTTPRYVDQFLAALNAEHIENDAVSEAEIARRGREAGKALEALGC